MRFEHLVPGEYTWELLPEIYDTRLMPDDVGGKFKATVSCLWLHLSLARPKLSWERNAEPLP